jgi:hypothetical protein
MRREVLPLEIWDLWVGGQILWEYTEKSDFAGALREALCLLQAGRGTTRSDGNVPAEIAGFEAVFVTGGRSVDRQIERELGSLPFKVLFDDGGNMAAERGGFGILEEFGKSGWVLDLGQTRLKVASRECRMSFERDYQKLPVRGEETDAIVAEQRQLLREFVSSGLKKLAAEQNNRLPEAMVIALPCHIGDGGELDGSSYVGMRGDQWFVSDVMQLAGMASVEVLLLNDAELAAHGARFDPRVSREEKTLVLTLGFGVGGALLLPCR